MKHYDYLVVGSGLFGAVFTAEAVRRENTVLVIDKRDHIGGNVFTKKYGIINVHYYGAHIFHTSNKEVWDYVNSFSEFNHFINSPLGFYDGRYYSLPFNMNTLQEMWGISTPEEAKKIIDEQTKKENIQNPKNLEEQALSLVGRDIYEKLIKGYTEKQWGRKATELPAFIIKRIPLRFEYNNNYFNDIYQGIPVGGYTLLIEKMLKGADIRLSCDFTVHKNELKDIADKIIYTGPIDEYFNYRFGELEYRSLKFVIERYERDFFQKNCVVNYEEYEVPYTRIIEHKYFENTECPYTVITKEYPDKYELGKERYYPINDDKNTKLYKKYADLASNEVNVIFGGRLATYKYLDMDDTIEESLKLSRQILK